MSIVVLNAETVHCVDGLAISEQMLPPVARAELALSESEKGNTS